MSYYNKVFVFYLIVGILIGSFVNSIAGGIILGIGAVHLITLYRKREK